MKEKGVYSLMIAFILVSVATASFIFLDTEVEDLKEQVASRSVAELHPYWTMVRYVLPDAASDGMLDWKWDDVTLISECTNTLDRGAVQGYIEDNFDAVFSHLLSKDGKTCSISTMDVNTLVAANEFRATFDLECGSTFGEHIVQFRNSVEVWKQLVAQDVSVPQDDRCRIIVTDLLADTNATETKTIT